MSKWKGSLEYGFLCKEKRLTHKTSWSRASKGEGSPPAAGTACFHGTPGQGADWMVMMHRAWADFCVLDEGGGLESHAFIYLISKTAVFPLPLSRE